MEKILKSYLRRLTNLTSSNRSLLLLRLLSDQYVDIHDLDFADELPSFEIIRQLMGRKQTISLSPVHDPRDEKANQQSLKLKRLQRVERFIHEERGSRDLYVGWPFLRGQFSEGTALRAPLLFFPVELDIHKESWVLRQRDEVNTTLNKSFLLAYSFFNKTKLSEDLLERVFDDFDTDSTVFRTALYQLFKESPIKLNFNPEIFSDRLISFETFNKKDFEEKTRTGEIKLYPEAVLGIFPQAGSHLVPDYLHLMENSELESLEDFFTSKTWAPKVEVSKSHQGYEQLYLRRVKEEQTITPFQLDAWQESAIKAIKEGNSVVVQGPPGTGKSQLICNLISDNIANGKKVLLVSQKRVALDVVYGRLKHQELSDFVGLVHDFKNDRRAIYKKIAEQIEQVTDYQQRNNSLDIIQIERSFTQASRTIDRLTEDLEEFKLALFDETECGRSAKELYLTSDRAGVTINVNQEYKHFSFEGLETFLNRLEEFVTYAGEFMPTSYLLRNRKPFIKYKLQDLRNMQDILQEIPEFQKQIGRKTKKITSKELTLEDCDYIIQKRTEVDQMMEILADKKVYKYFQEMSKLPMKDTEPLSFTNSERVLMACFKGEGVESSLPTSELGRFHKVLDRAMEARRNPIRFFKWFFFSKDKFYIKRVLVANGLRKDGRGYKALMKKLDNRLNLEHNVTKLKEKSWLIDVPSQYRKVTFQSWFHNQKQALKAKGLFYSIRNFKEYFTVHTLDLDEFKAKVDLLFDTFAPIDQTMTRWAQYFSSAQLVNIGQDETLAYRLSELLNKDFDALCEFDSLKHSLKSYELDTLNKLLDLDEDVAPDFAKKVFLNSLSLSWIDHIETKFPILRSTASLKFHKMLTELQNAVDEKQRVSRDIVLIRARERTYSNVQFNRLNNMVTYRDLQHQVSKKRRIWPLRKLLTHFYHELFDLLPCWMASPESVSAIFPMTENLFDLVIFDEASQCFAERGLPAIFRARQMAIAGDNMQLRPNDLYQIRWDEDDPDEDEAALEIDSLLELTAPHLMNIQLRGHYRSQSLDLIDFSNHHFYGGKLRMLPDRRVIGKNEPAINFIRVNGTWEANTNLVEARKVAELIKDLGTEHPEKSIGIVTFNAKQQNLIMDILEEELLNGTIKADLSGVFVKNIENVQGDERDVIVFSTAYAKDKNGRLVMQFGSLNLEGGENRLNVAVTRARERIIIVSSIHPDQLKVEDAKNEGPKLLKAYLSYALKVSRGEYRPQLPPDDKHAPGWYLKSKLANIEMSENVKVNADMPFADLTIMESGNYLGLVLTDDDLYYEAVSIKESFVYLPNVISSKNWKYREVFSREFWVDKEAVAESLNRFVNQNRSDAKKSKV